MPETADNPLLRLAEEGGLPPFSDIRPEPATPAVDVLLARARDAVAAARAAAEPTWTAVAEPVEAAEDALERVFSPVSHMHAVMNSAEWRAAYEACLPKLTAYATEMGQNRALFDAWRALADGPEYEHLDAARRKVVDNALRDFRLAGVDLPEAEKRRYAEIMQRLSELATRFQQNLLDATQAWRKHVTDESLLAGLPDSQKDLLAQNARNKDLDGWLITLDAPSFLAIHTYAEDRGLRREVYQAFVTRASDEGPHAGEYDNSELMDEIVALRHEAANLLGYRDYAERALATRMARSPDEVIDFLRDLAGRTRPRAEAERDDLAAFARERDGIDDLQAWDLGYYMDQLKRERFRLSAEDLRPYFRADRVIDGLFAIVQRLYGVRIRQVADVDVWHDDVTYYAIEDADGEPVGGFYLDPYAREDKRGGAWMADCVGRRRTPAGIQRPVAFVTCNFAPPVGGKPALLTHDEVTTLFHEFGHALHHLLTRVDTAPVAGISGVSWDAVELPSQFMENWCWQREALDLFARHHETGEPMPEDLFRRMTDARNFMSGLMMLRQIEFSLFDFLLHRDYDPAQGARVQATLDAVRAEVAVMTPPEWNRFAHGFAHIFAGGYAAGYYSYKWAEVLSADAFDAFEEAGIFDAETGARFREEILETGGSREALENFVAFRGREPDLGPLLRQSGLLDEGRAA